MTPPYMFLAPGKGPRSTSRTRRPARAATSAAAEPAGPAPTTTTSTVSAMTRLPRPGGLKVRLDTEAAGELLEQGRGVGHQRQVGHGHHRAAGIGVHRDHVARRAQAGDVLDRARDAERDVQVRVDGDAGGADVALVG